MLDGGLTLGEWMSIWPSRVGRDPRTVKTHQHRITKYIVPYLPGGTDRPLHQINRKHLHDIHAALLDLGLSKATIDGAISSLSAVLGYALREHRIGINPALSARVDPADTRLQPIRARQERRRIPPEEAGGLLDAVDSRHWALILTPFLSGVRPEELLALRAQDIDIERELIMVHQRVVPGGGRPDKPGVLKVGLKERRRLVREALEVRGRWALFPRVLHPDRTGRAIKLPSEKNVLPLARSEFLYVTGRTRGSRGEQLSDEQKRQGSLWSQRNLYRDVVVPAREAANTAFTLYDARHTFVSTLMGAGVPLAEVAAYSGHSVGEARGGRGRRRSAAIADHARGVHARDGSSARVGARRGGRVLRAVAQRGTATTLCPGAVTASRDDPRRDSSCEPQVSFSSAVAPRRAPLLGSGNRERAATPRERARDRGARTDVIRASRAPVRCRTCRGAY